MHTDITRVNPFVSTFTLKAVPEVADNPRPGPPVKPQAPELNGTLTRSILAPPQPREVRKTEWNNFEPPFTKYDGLRIKNDGQGGYDYYVNLDNAFLLTELAHTKEDDKPRVKFWFTWGLVLAAVGMLRHNKRLLKEEVAASNNGNSIVESEEDDKHDLETVSHYCNGLAQVVIPIIRTLNHGPVD